LIQAIECPAIKPLLLLRLQTAVSLCGKALGVSVAFEDEVQLPDIPLRGMKGAMPLIYVSAIAHKVANSWQKPVIDVATEIGSHLFDPDRASQRSADAALQDFTIKIVPPGWIYLQLSDAAIAAWLQRLAQAPPWLLSRGAEGQVNRGDGETLDLAFSTPPAQSKIQNPSGLFSIQYAHARCCSLLRLAHREGIIVLEEPDPESSPIYFGAMTPNPIPWLDTDQKLRLVHPAERSLIFQLLTLLDDLYCPPAHGMDWKKSAGALSSSFETFYSQCRIWGEVKTEAPQLAQARLGLIVATQSLLRLLLEDLLGIQAPLEL
jgi:DALR anticodon binding domain